VLQTGGAALAAIATVPRTAKAVDWINPAGGSFQDGSNWSTGMIPAATDSASFPIAGTVPYTVTFSADAQSDGVSVFGAPLTFDLGTHQFIANYLSITSSLSLTNGSVHTSVVGEGTGAAVVVGAGAGWTVDQQLGVDSGAQLNVVSGGVFSDTNRSGVQIGVYATAAVNVAGAGSLFQHGGLTIGSGGILAAKGSQGLLNVTSGGSVQGRDVDIGAIGSGTITISGVSGTSRSSFYGRDVIIGNYGTGSLSVSDGALFSASAGIEIGNEQGGSGRVTIGGSLGGYDATVVAPTLTLAGTGNGLRNRTGQLAISAGGNVIISGNLRLGDASPEGVGKVALSDGSISVGSLSVESGSFEIASGSLTSNGNEDIGVSAYGPDSQVDPSSVVQTGGVHVATISHGGAPSTSATITIGRSSQPVFGIESYHLAGGTLQANVVNYDVFTLTGGSFFGHVTNQATGTFATAGNPLISGSITNLGSFAVTSGVASVGNIDGSGVTSIGGSASASLSVGSISQAKVTVSAGGTMTMRSSTNRITNAITIVSLTGSGTLDFANHSLLTSTAPATIKSYLASAYTANQDWSGPGLTSSVASSNPTKYSLAYASGSDQSAQDAGIPVAPGQTLVQGTLTGDANMDGTVNFFDITQLLGYKYNTGQPASYTDGDLNYDGVVDFFDLSLLLSANYNTGEQYLGAAAASPSAQSIVPEPAGSFLAALPAVRLLHRRRRRLRRPLRIDR
jgi:hypothetical protein